MPNSELCRPGGTLCENQRKRKAREEVELCQRIKKNMEHEVIVIPIVTGALGTVTKGLIKGLEYKRTRGDHVNYSIIKIGQIAEKSPGDLKRLAVTQTPVKNHQQTLV